MHSTDSYGRVCSFVRRLLIAVAFLGTNVALQDISRAADPATAFVYVGTYTSGANGGIYLFRMDLATGELKLKGTTPADNSSYLASDPAQRFLFSVGEMDHFQGRPEGSVTAFARDVTTGALTRLNQQSSGGEAPCHDVVDHAGKNVLAANYDGGSVVVLPIEADGRLRPASDFIQHHGSGPNRGRQEKAHAHGIAISPDNRFALVADLGSDRIFVYRFDAKSGKLRPNDPPSIHAAPGAGPRHVAFHPNGKFVYPINELASTVTMMSYDAEHGRLEAHQSISTLPPDAKLPATGNTAAELAIDPTGRFLYGSNRGHDTLAMFSIDRETGRLTTIGYQPTGGRTPRGFAIDPSGKWLVVGNQDSSDVRVFGIDRRSGLLTPTGVSVSVEKPACVEILEQ